MRMQVLRRNLLLVTLALAGQAVAAADSHDHFQYGFDLDGAHREVPCESCHVRGIFQGTPRECGYCHDGTGIYAQSARSVVHPVTSENCEACHVVANWAAIGPVDHAEVLGACTSCHDGRLADGLPAFHLRTTQQCDDCHTTIAWAPAVFDHSGVAPGACESCHDGVTATGKHALHMATSASCDTCHSTIAWVPALFDHGNVAPGSCATCHDGQRATGMDVGHFQTTLACDDCHTSDFWVPHIFQHTALGYEPLDHRGNPPCTDCHTASSDLVAWQSPGYQPDCAGCHANDYRPGVDRHNGIALDANCAQSGCHSISDREW
jgi:predicted CXXCH cytochrome family protein